MPRATKKRRVSGPDAPGQRESMGSEAMSTPDPEAASSAIFNTTFATYRVSPLYIGDNTLDQPRLDVISHRLRDSLVGDVVRGVEVRLQSEDSGLGRAGALEHIEIQWTTALGHRPDSCLQFSLQYENLQCTALLLPHTDRQVEHADHSQNERFLRLPLLLLRMPAPLKSAFVEFLSVTFDCRVQPLHVGTRTLTRSWEDWRREVSSEDSSFAAKDLLVTLGFHVPATQDTEDKPGTLSDEGVEMGLKGVDVIIPSKDIRRFAEIGESIQGKSHASEQPGPGKQQPSWTADKAKRRALAGGNSEEGWLWRGVNGQGEHEAGSTSAGEPSLDALARYLQYHLAINLFHPSVRITRVACGGFVMSDGRLKLFAPPDASLVVGLSAAHVVLHNVIEQASR